MKNFKTGKYQQRGTFNASHPLRKNGKGIYKCSFLNSMDNYKNYKLKKLSFLPLKKKKINSVVILVICSCSIVPAIMFN